MKANEVGERHRKERKETAASLEQFRKYDVWFLAETFPEEILHFEISDAGESLTC